MNGGSTEDDRQHSRSATISRLAVLSVMFMSPGSDALFQGGIMAVQQQPNIKLVNDPEYREGYANSVQVRVSVWDFLMVFGRMQPQSVDQVEIHNFQGVYVSPQQAKALVTILQQNVSQYEAAFGEIKLDSAITPPPGPIH
jgi:flagellar protein FlaG